MSERIPEQLRSRGASLQTAWKQFHGSAPFRTKTEEILKNHLTTWGQAKKSNRMSGWIWAGVN
jgi:hypothetical protein